MDAEDKVLLLTCIDGDINASYLCYLLYKSLPWHKEAIGFLIKEKLTGKKLADWWIHEKQSSTLAVISHIKDGLVREKRVFAGNDVV